MRFLASGFLCLILLWITVSVISEEIGPRSNENHHPHHHHDHHENGEPGCWGNGPRRGPEGDPRSGPGRGLPPPPPPPSEVGPSDDPDDGNDGDDGNDEDFAVDGEDPDEEVGRMKDRSGQSKRIPQDMGNIRPGK